MHCVAQLVISAVVSMYEYKAIYMGCMIQGSA